MVEWIDQKATRFVASCTDSGDMCHCGMHVLPFPSSSRERVRAQQLITVYGNAAIVVFLFHGSEGFLYLPCITLFRRVHGILERARA